MAAEELSAERQQTSQKWGECKSNFGCVPELFEGFPEPSNVQNLFIRFFSILLCLTNVLLMSSLDSSVAAQETDNVPTEPS